MLCAQFTPRNFPIAVGVQAERVVEVAQRDIPLPTQAFTFANEGQIAVAWLVGLRRNGGQGEDQGEQGPHRASALNAFAVRCMAGSS